jgi:hypothetical protein
MVVLFENSRWGMLLSETREPSRAVGDFILTIKLLVLTPATVLLSNRVKQGMTGLFATYSLNSQIETPPFTLQVAGCSQVSMMRKGAGHTKSTPMPFRRTAKGDAHSLVRFASVELPESAMAMAVLESHAAPSTSVQGLTIRPHDKGEGGGPFLSSFG